MQMHLQVNGQILILSKRANRMSNRAKIRKYQKTMLLAALRNCPAASIQERRSSWILVPFPTSMDIIIMSLRFRM
mgnify:CR=1 FL=1